MSTAQAQVNAQASYIVTLGGINIASVNVDLSEASGSYQLDLDARVTGMGSLVAGGSARAGSAGTVSGSTLSPQQFELMTRARDETFTVAVSFASRNVSAFQVQPPVMEGADRVPIERSHLNGVGDMLSSFLIKGGSLEPSLCERQSRIFTGVERFDLAMGFAGNDEATSPRTGYQGPVILCAIDYRPVSGHYRSSEITSYLAESDRILLWYAPLGDTGYFVPYRALVGTTSGDLSMVLTGMSY
jgi:hypothetical protein